MVARGWHWQKVGFVVWVGLMLCLTGWLLDLFSFSTYLVELTDLDEFTECDWDNFDFVGKYQDDPMLIEYVRHQIQPPSVFPYALVEPQLVEFSTFPSQFVHIKKLFGEMRNGFFIEVGAYDGESHSNTLYWERNYGWSGLLIEPDPANYHRLLSKSRKSFTLNACLCPTNISERINFITNQGMTGQIVGTPPPSDKTTSASIPCFPFYTILAALNFPPIHYLSLDIEGYELKVLHTLPPLKTLDIAVMLVEHLNLKEGFDTLNQFMNKSGYTLFEKDYYDGLFYRIGA